MPSLLPRLDCIFFLMCDNDMQYTPTSQSPQASSCSKAFTSTLQGSLRL